MAQTRVLKVKNNERIRIRNEMSCFIWSLYYTKISATDRIICEAK